MKLPKLLVSSVIRGTQLGDSHGGLYLVDLENGCHELKVDWDRADIDLDGRGGDRGLRGIAFHGERILVAANAQLLMLDQDFAVVETFTNPFLRHCHEIAVADGRVFFTATGFDSILMFDLEAKRFVAGWHLDATGSSLQLRFFDPLGSAGPPIGHRFHLNSISASSAGLWFSGLHTPGLLFTDARDLSLAAPLPPGTHNAQLLADGILYNDTVSDRICYHREHSARRYDLPDFPINAILNTERFVSDVARPRFARGLCVVGNGLIAGGCSPSTVSLYDVESGARLLDCNLSMDIRNAVHGLAVWPF